MKLSIAILISIIAHVILLYVLSNTYQPKAKDTPVNNQSIITAQIIMMEQIQPEQLKPEPELKPEPKLEQKQEPVQEQEQEPFKTTKPAEQKALAQTSQPSTEPEPKPKPAPEIKKPAPKVASLPEKTSTPQASFDPYASLNQLIEQQNADFLNSNNVTSAEQKAKNNAINRIPSTITSLNSAEQSHIKDIFETAQRIDPDTRVVNYNGTCVQIKRELDFNGFSQFKWAGTSLPCGKDDATTAQLKESLGKFIR